MNFNDILNKTSDDNVASSSSTTLRVAPQPPVPQTPTLASGSTKVDYTNFPIPGLASPFQTPAPHANVSAPLSQPTPAEATRQPPPRPLTRIAPASTDATNDEATSSSLSQPGSVPKKRKTMTKVSRSSETSKGDVDNAQDDDENNQDDGDEARDEEGKPKRKRRRQALSCMPCKRRKIRCDRLHPCTPCVKRNDQSSCLWSVVEASEKEVPGQSIIPVASPFPPPFQSPPAPEERYVLRSEYEELKATVARLESIVAAFAGASNITSHLHAQRTSHTHDPSLPPTSKLAAPSSVVTSAAPHALYTPVNQTYQHVLFTQPESSIRPGSSSPDEANGMLKYLNLPSGSGNSPPTHTLSSASSSLPRGEPELEKPSTSTRDELSSRPDTIVGRARDQTQHRQHTMASSNAHTEETVALPSFNALTSFAASSSTRPGARYASETHSSPLDSTLPPRSAHSLSPAAPRESDPSRSSSTSRSSEIRATPAPDKRASPAAASASDTYRPTTLTRIALSSQTRAPSVPTRSESRSRSRSRTSKEKQQDIDKTATAPISSLITARWQQQQAKATEARKKPVLDAHQNGDFVTADSPGGGLEYDSEGEGYDDRSSDDEDYGNDGKHSSEGSMVDQLASSSPLRAPEAAT